MIMTVSLVGVVCISSFRSRQELLALSPGCAARPRPCYGDVELLADANENGLRTGEAN